MKIKTNKKRLSSIVSRFRGKKILVIGDLILDHHIFGDVERVSPEAPVPVVWAKRESFTCGGAANVGLNLCSLGAKASLSGVIGNDHFGSRLLELIKDSRIDARLVISDKARPTTLKTRIIAHKQQVVRLDWESAEPLSMDLNSSLSGKIKRYIDEFDAVIVEDYGKGVVNPLLTDELIRVCRKKGRIVTVDPKDDNFDCYEGVTALTPNLNEAQAAANFKIKSRLEIPLLGRMIMERIKPSALLITLGAEGMMLFSEDGSKKDRTRHIPTAALEVFDVTGAGDTVISVFTLALTCGASFYEAAEIANLAAGIVVGKSGAATADCKELKRAINER